MSEPVGYESEIHLKTSALFLHSIRKHSEERQASMLYGAWFAETARERAESLSAAAHYTQCTRSTRSTASTRP